MKATPILFSAPMVRALLDGRKTQTRRIVKPQPNEDGLADDALPADPYGYAWRGSNGSERQCLYGQPGDQLWVKEDFTFLSLPHKGQNAVNIQYKADGERRKVTLEDREVELFCRRRFPLRPTLARFMYRNCARITLEITAVRVERLQDISDTNAIAEGIGKCDGAWESYSKGLNRCVSPLTSYRTLWEAINGTGSWVANPWVWVLSFKRINP